MDFELLPTGSYYIFVDGFTTDLNLGPDEGSFILNVDIERNSGEDCKDGLDNDGNGYADCADSACQALPECASCNQGGPAIAEYGAGPCTDGVDNDCDGEIDCDDSDCSASPEAITECCTGADQNGNGIADDNACRCARDSDCIDGQLCYTSTLGSCGIPCENYVGQVCPFFAPGSTCNTATHQCEY